LALFPVGLPPILKQPGDRLLNKINGIASTNPGYAQALQRGAQILQQVGYFK
jgi:hypothetical protein